MHLVLERVRGKNVRCSLAHSSPSFFKSKQAEPLASTIFPLQPFSSRPPNSHVALWQAGFTLHLVPEHDELNIPGDFLWCLNLMDQCLLSFSGKMEKKLSAHLTVRLLSNLGSYPPALDWQFVRVCVCVCAGVCAWCCLWLARARDTCLPSLPEQQIYCAKWECCIWMEDAPE